MKDKLLKERKEIIDVMEYRDGNFYVGGLATAHVCGILGFRYGDNFDFKKEIEQADNSEIRRIHVYLSSYIDHMKKNPVRFCPCCKQQIINEYWEKKMKTEVTHTEKTKKFEDIAYKKSEAHSGIFFQIIEPNKEFLDCCATTTPFEENDVLITVDQDFFTLDYEEGEVCFNLTKSTIIYVPYNQKIYTLLPCDDEPIKFMRV